MLKVMEQIAFSLPPSLPYTAENFYEHRGVQIYGEVLNLLKRKDFQLCFIYAPARFGKTHLAVRLVHDMAAQGKLVALWEGEQLESKLSALGDESCDVYVIDDAHTYLGEMLPGMSGPFVNLVEQLRSKHRKLCLLSSLSLEHLPADEHIMSRLRAGATFMIKAPPSEEIGKMLEILARQRGVVLSRHKLDFLSRRLGHDIPAMEHYLESLMRMENFAGKGARYPLLAQALGN